MSQSNRPTQRPTLPWRANLPPMAPRLLKGGLCSDCGVPAITTESGDYRICPKCYGVLWHRDFSAEERRKKAEQAEARAIALVEEKKKKAEERARKHKVRLQAEDLVAAPAKAEAPTLDALSGEGVTTSSPELGAPELKSGGGDGG